MENMDNRRDFSIQVYGREATEVPEEVGVLHFDSFSSTRLDYVHQHCQNVQAEIEKQGYIVTAFGVVEYEPGTPTIAANTVIEVLDEYFKVHTAPPASLREIRGWFDQSGLKLPPVK